MLKGDSNVPLGKDLIQHPLDYSRYKHRHRGSLTITTRGQEKYKTNATLHHGFFGCKGCAIARKRKSGTMKNRAKAAVTYLIITSCPRGPARIGQQRLAGQATKPRYTSASFLPYQIRQSSILYGIPLQLQKCAWLQLPDMVLYR